jgi:hypothetical protein
MVQWACWMKVIESRLRKMSELLFKMSEELEAGGKNGGADQTRCISHPLIPYQYTRSFELSASHGVSLRLGHD